MIYLEEALLEARQRAVEVAEIGTINGLEAKGLVVIPIPLLRQFEVLAAQTEAELQINLSSGADKIGGKSNV